MEGHLTKKGEEEREFKELAVYELLDDLGISYTRLDHEAVYTIEGCDEIGGLLGVKLCKNLFLCNSQRTKFYLLMMPGDKRFVTREFCRQIQSPRLSFAPPEYMEQFLNITPGSVSVMGLMNDTENRVQLVIDRQVLEMEYIGCHPCVNTSSIRLSTKDLAEKFLPRVKHDYWTVEL
ncbi:MAG TPA: prolyl-tRNA synthetase associated domain-containing protein [Candidatus Acetatifactor stercoripullorum]|uniref:Prolyl-tRNA synthetase associated domain-containing protein n=1 Tax=Candidatus Acetatifactor stercoripullorum TaxID=2838414 RepID=A0A9D1R6Q6_9FIRM|nr:prolyl-tRNA synthetase associated domain-containing protein [uncultured Acetatifactor sp.]HIW81071.1 prolyl-tRNA synthetase associated domain-containing protein [Candidatus Acetatifactor stercoripullorum]